jgi:uncharacterized protein YqhQ
LLVVRITGGQALIAGIALRSDAWRVAVVRRASGELVVGTGPARPSRFRGVPFLRGVVAWLIEAPVENEWAAAKIEEDLSASEDREGERAPEPEGIYRGGAPVVRREELPEAQTRRVLPLLIGTVFTQAVPQALLYFALRAAGVELASAPATAGFQACLFVAMFAILVLYFLGVRRFPDMRRVIQYGAAFKQALWAAASKDERPSDKERSLLILRSHPTWHPRGGAFTMGLVALVLTLLVPVVAKLAALPAGPDHVLAAHAAACGLRVLLIPIVVAIVDEVQRPLARPGLRLGVAILFAPFVLLESLLTAPADDEHLEVARTALVELDKLDAR